MANRVDNDQAYLLYKSFTSMLGDHTYLHVFADGIKSKLICSAKK